MSGLIALEVTKERGWRSPNVMSVGVKKSLPYAESSGGEYTHRVRSARLHNMTGYEPHTSISCWCGMSLLVGKRHKGGFVAEPTPGRPMCATCEGRAIGAGVDGSHKINGRMARFQPRMQMSMEVRK